jgi:hypothetical protein
MSKLANVNPADLVKPEPTPSFLKDEDGAKPKSGKKPPFREVDGYFYDPATKKFQNLDGVAQEPFTFENAFVIYGIDKSVIQANPFEYATPETVAEVTAFALKIPDVFSVLKHTKQLDLFAADSHPQYFIEIIFANGKTIFSNAGAIASQIIRSGESAVAAHLKDEAEKPEPKVKEPEND